MKLESFVKVLTEAKDVLMVGPMFLGHYLPQIVDLDEPLPIIFVDGGMAFFDSVTTIYKNSIPFKLGDGDSTDSTLDLSLNKDKDFTDFECALSLIVDSIKLKRLYLCGFLNGRKDHEWVNIGRSFELLNSSLHLNTIFMDDKLTLCSKGEQSFSYHGSFGIISLLPVKLELSGQTKYKTEKKLMMTPPIAGSVAEAESQASLIHYRDVDASLVNIIRDYNPHNNTYY